MSTPEHNPEEYNMKEESEDDEFDEISEIQPVIVDKHRISAHSRRQYESSYEEFVKWKNAKGMEAISENVMLAYFEELSEVYKPPTLWSRYSMLRTIIIEKFNLNIQAFLSLSQFLKRKSEGYESKKTEVFEPASLKKFFLEATDDIYLAEKVVAIFWICGGCKVNEIIVIKAADVKDRGDLFVVEVPELEEKAPRQFLIGNEFYKIVKKYTLLRPNDAISPRFFYSFRYGKSVNQPLGKNKIRSMPKVIATFLKLPSQDTYTSYSFRGISPSLLADGSPDSVPINRRRPLKQSRVTASYVADFDTVDIKQEIETAYTFDQTINGEDQEAEDPSERSNGIFNFEPLNEHSSEHNAKRPKLDAKGVIEISGPNNKESLDFGPNSKIRVQLPDKAPITISFNNCKNCSFFFNQ